MEEAFRVVRIAVAMAVGVFVLGTPTSLGAKEKSKPPADASAPSAKRDTTKGDTAKRDTTKGGPPPGETVNACGCYHDAKGACVCTDKKGKCECPGECEPVGCGAKRDKEMEREMSVEIKRAQEDEKKRAEAREAQENGTAGGADAGEAPAPEPAPTRSAAKPPRKDATGKSGSKPETK